MGNLKIKGALDFGSIPVELHHRCRDSSHSHLKTHLASLSHGHALQSLREVGWRGLGCRGREKKNQVRESPTAPKVFLNNHSWVPKPGDDSKSNTLTVLEPRDHPADHSKTGARRWQKAILLPCFTLFAWLCGPRPPYLFYLFIFLTRKPRCYYNSSRQSSWHYSTSYLALY